MNKDEALKLALESLENLLNQYYADTTTRDDLEKAEAAITAIREALADSALDRMAENARELGLDYEPPCKTGSQCTNKCQQCEQPAQQEPSTLFESFQEFGEGWERLAWELCADENGEEACSELIWEGGPIPEPWGDRWLKYEDEAKRLIALVQKHTSPPAAQQQEPVAIVADHPERIDWLRDEPPDGTLLYTSPQPSKPWVGLTDEEMRDLEKQFNAERVRTSDEEYLVIYPGDYWAWQRAIEAKLKENNNG